MISDDELYNLSLKFGIWLFILILAYGFLQINFLTESKESELIDETEKGIKIENEIDDLIKKESKRVRNRVIYMKHHIFFFSKVYDIKFI